VPHSRHSAASHSTLHSEFLGATVKPVEVCVPAPRLTEISCVCDPPAVDTTLGAISTSINSAITEQAPFTQQVTYGLTRPGLIPSIICFACWHLPHPACPSLSVTSCGHRVQPVQDDLRTAWRTTDQSFLSLHSFFYSYDKAHTRWRLEPPICTILRAYRFFPAVSGFEPHPSGSQPMVAPALCFSYEPETFAPAKSDRHMALKRWVSSAF
jgi:hypothetical protein